jgi:ribonucleoside-diphosphate reductase alpha chain
MSGVSFLPFDDHTYQQAPYQDCSESDYNTLMSCMPNSINWEGLSEYEAEDNTSGMQTLACTGDVCEMVDIT